MTLDRAARVYVHWPFTADVVLTQASVHLAGAWHDAVVTGSEVVLLVAGPDAADNPADTAVLPLGVHWARIRFPDNPEIIVAGGGPIVMV